MKLELLLSEVTNVVSRAAALFFSSQSLRIGLFYCHNNQQLFLNTSIDLVSKPNWDATWGAVLDIETEFLADLGYEIYRFVIMV
jgi:hypothetical protein